MFHVESTEIKDWTVDLIKRTTTKCIATALVLVCYWFVIYSAIYTTLYVYYFYVCIFFLFFTIVGSFS